MRKYVLLMAGLFFAGLLFVFYQGFGSDPREVPFRLAGTQAPRFEMKRLDNDQMVKLEDYIGQPIVLNFWATWCGPCKMEHPVLEWGARRYGEKVVFLGVVFEDTEANTKKFLQENGASYQQLFDPKSTVAVDYAVSGVPETYFIDRSGVIRGKVAMPIDPRTLDARIQEILQ